MAVEDIGLADPRALEVALAGRDAYRFLGSPEGDLALAEVAVYLATSPKSNRIYRAWSAAGAAARETPSAAVPLAIRNAPTDLMKDLGYGEAYRYDPDVEGGVAPQQYLPDAVAERRFYEPGPFGYEKTLGERMRWFDERRSEAAARERDEETP
jgi:putative ATPase